MLNLCSLFDTSALLFFIMIENDGFEDSENVTLILFTGKLNNRYIYGHFMKNGAIGQLFSPTRPSQMASS